MRIHNPRHCNYRGGDHAWPSDGGIKCAAQPPDRLAQIDNTGQSLTSKNRGGGYGDALQAAYGLKGFGTNFCKPDRSINNGYKVHLCQRTRKLLNQLVNALGNQLFVCDNSLLNLLDQFHQRRSERCTDFGRDRRNHILE